MVIIAAPTRSLQEHLDIARLRDARQNLIEFDGKLFVEEKPFQVDLIETNGKGTKLHYLDARQDLDRSLEKLGDEGDCPDSLETSLEGRDDDNESVTVVSRDTMSDYCGSFYLIRPQFGRGPLLITLDGMQSILSQFDVFCPFYRFLETFAARTFARDEVFGGLEFAWKTNESGDVVSLELCYLLKYVESRCEDEKNGLPVWTIRHGLIYQNVSFLKASSSHILVRPSQAMTRRLQDVLHPDRVPVDISQQFVGDWTRLHSLFIDTVDINFREFANRLDKDITDLLRRASMVGTNPAQLRGFDTTEQSSRDIATLLILEDQARRLSTAIRVNIDMITGLTDRAGKLKALNILNIGTNDGLDRLQDELDTFKTRHTFALRNVDVLIKRAQRVSQQLSETASLRNNEINRLNAEQTKESTKLTGKMLQASGYEAHVVKTLTVLALVFAPASLVADFLQLEYVTVAEGKGFHLWTTDGLKLYAMLAAPLITITMAVYIVVELYIRRSKRSRGNAGADCGV